MVMGRYHGDGVFTVILNAISNQVPDTKEARITDMQAPKKQLARLCSLDNRINCANIITQCPIQTPALAIASVVVVCLS